MTQPALPGPRSWVPGRFLRALQREPIPFLSRLAREYGDAVSFPVAGHPVVFFNHPDLIREVLVGEHRHFHKSPALKRAGRVFGQGLLTSEDELHRRQRRLAQPAFHHRRIARYGEVMAERAARLAGSWRDGQVVDMHREMMRLTLAIVAKTLFDADIEREAGDIGESLAALIDVFPKLIDPVSNFTRRLPLPWTRRFERGIEKLDRIVYGIIEARRRSGEDRGDLLSMLLLALDEEGDGGGMSDRQLRDEAMTLFLAGHETTANALAWTLMLLAQNPAAAQALQREVDALGAPPGPADYPRLALAERTLAESMRLYPPAWGVSRLALEDVAIGPWKVPRHAVVLVSQAVMHRDARYWPDPGRFEPARFTDEAKAARPRMAYFPFGGGPRTCIGEGFAWMEGVLILAALAQRWKMELLAVPKPRASITLRPFGGMPMRLIRR